jgi:hypothetical protein
LPPFAIIYCPLTYPILSLASETARNAISSGLPHRLIESWVPGGKDNPPSASPLSVPPAPMQLAVMLSLKKGHSTKSVAWQQSAKGFPQTNSGGEKAYELRDPMAQSLERLKWFLSHRNVYQALQVIQSAGMDREGAVADTRDSTAQKPLKLCMEPPTLMPDLTGEYCEAIVRTLREGQQGAARWPCSETDSLQPPGR